MKGSTVKLACSLFGVVLALSIVPSIAFGGPHRANCIGNNTIQKALDVAHDGDVFEVSGVCTENIVIDKNRIRLRGVDGAIL